MLVDLIIPTYKPDDSFLKLIEIMQSQSVSVNRIIIMNTEQKFFERIVYSNSSINGYKNIEIKHISKKEFDHGKTRNKGVARSEADYFLMMTQDAMPVGNDLVKRLLNAFEEDDKVAVAYARQVAADNAEDSEKYAREFNYPVESATHSQSDVPSLGIKAYFCSNVCAMYRRDIFDELGGFMNHVIFNEDMLYAAKAINAGYRIAYVADAQVIHSHNYSNKEYYKRNFDIGVSHAMHPDIFEGLNTKGEGMKLVRRTTNRLRSTGHFFGIFKVYVTSAYKYLGYRSGKHYTRLSKKAIMRKTLNPGFWIAHELEMDRKSIDAYKGYGRSSEELEMMAKPPVSSSYKRPNPNQEAK